jgi:long-chain fatty acid transport protein
MRISSDVECLIERVPRLRARHASQPERRLERRTTVKAGRMRAKGLAGAVLALTAFGASNANANGFAIRAQSTVGLGMSFAGAGTPGMGLSAMFWNPSAASQAKELSAELHTTFIGYEAHITAQQGTTQSLLDLGAADNVGKPGTVAAMYAAHEFAPNWFAGVSIDAPFGLGTHADSWAGQQLAVRAAALSLEAVPVIGWKYGMVSIAAGPRVLWFKGTFSRATFGSTALPPLPVRLVADDVGVGFIAGATLTLPRLGAAPSTGTTPVPKPLMEIALGYRSQVDLDLRGKSQFPSSPLLAQGQLAAFNGTTEKVSASLTLPDQAILGVRWNVTDRFALLGTAEWTQWSVLQTVPFIFTDGPAPGAVAAAVNFNYRNSRYFAAGTEYEWSDNVTLRAGIGYDVSPIVTNVRSTAIPEGDSSWWSAGLTYKATDHITLDLAYLYLSYNDAPIAVVPGHADFAILQGASFIANADSHAHVVSIGLRYQM